MSRRRERDEYRIRLSLNVCVCCVCPHKCLVSVEFFLYRATCVPVSSLKHTRTLPVQRVFSGNMQGFLCSFSPFAHQNLKLVKRNLKVINGFDGPTINSHVSSKAFLSKRDSPAIYSCSLYHYHWSNNKLFLKILSSLVFYPISEYN